MGSNKSKSQSFSSQTSGPPQWVQDQGQNIYSQAQDLVQQNPTYQAYQGQGVAPLSQNWNTANSWLTNMLQGGNQDFSNSRDILSQIQGTVNPNATTQDYMSPYLQGALTPTLDAIRQQGGLTQQGIDAQATGAGAFGDTGHALLKDKAYFDTQKQVADTTGQMYNTGFNNAQTQQNTALQRLLGVAQAGQSLGTSDASQQTGLASMINQLGTQQQQQQQQQDTYNLNQYQTGQAFPYQNLQFLQSMLKGTPVQTTTTGTQTGTQSSPNSAGAGLGGQVLGSILGSGGTGGLFGSGSGLFSGLGAALAAI